MTLKVALHAITIRKQQRMKVAVGCFMRCSHQGVVHTGSQCHHSLNIFRHCGALHKFSQLDDGVKQRLTVRAESYGLRQIMTIGNNPLDKKMKQEVINKQPSHPPKHQSINKFL